MASLEADEHANDPFLSSTSSAHQRYSNFDSQLFALSPSTSPEQVKRVLQAHLAETERRIQEASKLGTSLVQQRKDLADRLKEVEHDQSEGDIGPELRQKLVEIEREYNEVGRESAKAFLPKSRVSSSEVAAGSPYAVEKRSQSPSKYESQATNSPSKLGVPNRKQRNQPSTRVHDIEFATEISTSLLSQVRHLQSLLSEKEDTLKGLALENSRLEVEAEGFNQRLRSLDESENRYKDENWNLETQIHEHLATAKESADRETKLHQSLNILQAEKSRAQKELDEIKLSHSKLSEDHATILKHHDVELGSVKRSMQMAENERGALQRKVDDLTGQNQELAKAISQQRGRPEDRDLTRGFDDDEFEMSADNVTPEHSPPPSPVKGTPRHSMLESETLKTSLHHAHRMIQSLKGNIHREKTEKLELKRLLQDARDEIENRRNDGGLVSSNGKKNRKVDSKEFKKPPRPNQLGGPRNSRSEVIFADEDWEEDNQNGSHSSSSILDKSGPHTNAAALISDTSDHFETATEEGEAFETANERGTETEDFQTGAEDLSGSDDLTETEQIHQETRKRPPISPLNMTGSRHSFQSTASTSADEYEEVKTPTAPQPQRLKLRFNRSNGRRSRMASEEPQLQSSPASFMDRSVNGTPQAGGQSLFAELGSFDGSDDESLQGTPSRTPSSRPSTAKLVLAPETEIPPIPSLPMVDSGMMTEPWEPEPQSYPVTALAIAGGASAGLAGAEVAHVLSEASVAQPHSDYQVPTADSADWKHESNTLNILSDNTVNYRPISTSTYSDMSSQYDPTITDEKLAQFPAPPSPKIPFNTPLPSLIMSDIVSEQVEPISPELPIQHAITGPISAALCLSSIHSINTEPIESSGYNPVLISHGPLAPSIDSSQLVGEQPTMLKSKQNDEILPLSKNRNILPSAPIIAEDDTRQSPSDFPIMKIWDSRQPFKEISNNGASKKASIETNDESSQTALTAEEIDTLFKSKKQATIISDDGRRSEVYSPTRGSDASSLRNRRSQESVGSVGRARSKMIDPDFIHDSVPLKRPTSANSVRKSSISSVHPPLPNDHKEAIAIATAAQHTGSSSGVSNTMGPPPIPNKQLSSFRPRTPSSQAPVSQHSHASPSSMNPGLVSRNVRPGSAAAELYTSSITGARSRRSSVTSFASEIDTRFNMRPGMPGPHGLAAGTDPRMINAITQTMIGEYLWKYTRKAGRGTLSDNRHRRYFWVHPYTRTLYWSDRDPSQAGRAELKAKSVPIEAVRVVTDDNPMPPGLHRKSLVIITPGRDVKFTATTGQRHETWFNALSYLLLRVGEGESGDVSEAANAANATLTRDDVNEFNPGAGGGSVRRRPGSISSYNSRTTSRSTRTSLNQPQLGHDSTSSRTTGGRLSRLGSYWKPVGKESQADSMSSRRSRHSIATMGAGGIYEASEVHDSAEDLREMIEKQDRESDKLENVRACCDGKHDVGHLHNHSIKSRHSNLPGSSSASQPPRTVSRVSVRRVE